MGKERALKKAWEKKRPLKGVGKEKAIEKDWEKRRVGKGERVGREKENKQKTNPQFF